MNMAGELVDVSNPYIEYGHWLRLGTVDSIQYLSYKYNTGWRDSLMTVKRLIIDHIENFGHKDCQEIVTVWVDKQSVLSPKTGRMKAIFALRFPLFPAFAGGAPCHIPME